jgi:PAS domain S-box-containing protein
MSQAEEISLLGFVDTPILVGDPDGCIVYANPSFRRCFGVDGDDLMGQPLAMVFGGGAREVVLSVTASVLQQGTAARLKIREAGIGFTGLASPIEAEDDRVGVIMVLLEEDSNEEHLSVMIEEVSSPLSAALKNLQALTPPITARVTETQCESYEDALQSLEEAQSSLRELHLVVRGGKPKQGRFDVSAAIMRVSERVTRENLDEVDVRVLMPPNLPRVIGTGPTFERMLASLLRQRIDEGKEGQPLTLLARTMGDDEPQGVLVSLVDVPDAARRKGTGLPPESVQQGIMTMGGEAICVEDSMLGRVTSLRLAIASS